ncbi:anti-sigma factor [Glutamicibacter nicotianae]
MNGSHSQHRDEPQDENLGLDLVSQVASSSRATKTKPKRWIFAVTGLAIIVVLALVIFTLLNGGTKASKASKADDAVTQTVELKSGGQAVLSSSESENAVGVELSELPALDGSEQYVAWAVHESGSVTMIVSSTGEDASAGLTPADDVIALHITIEGAKIPDMPSEDAEASVDLPLAQNQETQDAS